MAREWLLLDGSMLTLSLSLGMATADAALCVAKKPGSFSAGGCKLMQAIFCSEVTKIFSWRLGWNEFE